MTQDWKERYYITEFGRKCPPSQINTTLETIDEIIQSELDRQKEEIIEMSYQLQKKCLQADGTIDGVTALNALIKELKKL